MRLRNRLALHENSVRSSVAETSTMIRLPTSTLTILALFTSASRLKVEERIMDGTSSGIRMMCK